MTTTTTTGPVPRAIHARCPVHQRLGSLHKTTTAQPTNILQHATATMTTAKPFSRAAVAFSRSTRSCVPEMTRKHCLICFWCCAWGRSDPYQYPSHFCGSKMFHTGDFVVREVLLLVALVNDRVPFYLLLLGCHPSQPGGHRCRRDTWRCHRVTDAI